MSSIRTTHIAAHLQNIQLGLLYFLSVSTQIDDARGAAEVRHYWRASSLMWSSWQSPQENFERTEAAGHQRVATARPWGVAAKQSDEERGEA